MVFNAAGDGYCRRYFVRFVPIRISPPSAPGLVCLPATPSFLSPSARKAAATFLELRVSRITFSRAW